MFDHAYMSFGLDHDLKDYTERDYYKAKKYENSYSFFEGKMDEIRIYQRNLIQEELW